MVSCTRLIGTNLVAQADFCEIPRLRDGGRRHLCKRFMLEAFVAMKGIKMARVSPGMRVGGLRVKPDF